MLPNQCLLADERVKDVMRVSVIASEPISADRSRAALGDVLVTFTAGRMLLFTCPNSKQRYDEGIDTETLQQRFGWPVHPAE